MEKDLRAIEMNIIGCLFLDTENIYTNNLDVEDFYFEENKQLFNILKQFPEVRADTLLLELKIKQTYPETKINLPYLLECENLVTTIWYMPHYIEVLKLERKKEKIKEIVTGGQDLSVDKIIELHAMSYLPQKIEVCTLKQMVEDGGLDKILSNIGKRTYATGIKQLDDIIHGLTTAEVTTMAAGTGMGKTSFMLQVATNLARRKEKVLYLTCEMNADDLMQRILSQISGVESYKIRNKYLNEADKKIIIDCLSKDDFYQSPLKIIYMPIMTIDNINTAILENESKFVFLDHIQLIRFPQRKGRQENRAQELTETMYDLKHIANLKEMAIVVGSQVSREGIKNKKANDYSPSYLRDSGGIENCSACVIEIVLENDKDFQGEMTPIWQMNIKVTKNRYGGMGMRSILFDRRSVTFM